MAGRRGVSLLEVLISVFVLSLGLLGVAAVLPVARHAIREAAKSDRASACGHAVLNDIKVRRMLNPGSWRSSAGQPIGSLDPHQIAAQQSDRRGYLLGESYAIDSMMIGTHSQPVVGSTSHWSDFPYNAAAPGSAVITGPGGQWTRLQRVTWRGVYLPPSSAGAVELNPLLAATVFEWHDDTMTPVPDDETERTRQVMLTDSVGTELKPEIAGDYSWLATVSPATQTYDFVKDLDVSPTDLADNLPYTYPENAPLYDVSVAIFYKRDLTVPGGDFGDQPPAERQVLLKFQGDRLGGGDVRLYPLWRSAGVVAAIGSPSKPKPDPANYLDVKKNEWMLVSGWYWYEYPYIDAGGARRAPQLKIARHKWYRIVTAGEIHSEDVDENDILDPGEDTNANGEIDWYRDVTLIGPDWNLNWARDLDGDMVRQEALATLFSGVVGVYSATVEF